jgi:GTPase SAR1 family protein
MNLDPACDELPYQPSVDIRELVEVADVMEEMKLGPNGGLVYAMEHLLNNMDWLADHLGDYLDDYLIIDCPGQIELCTHFPVIRTIVDFLKQQGYFVCSLVLIDSQFMTTPSKFISGSLLALSTMVSLETSHINIITKMDLLNKEEAKMLDDLIEPHRYSLADQLAMDASHSASEKRAELNDAIATVVEDFRLVSFITLNVKDADSIADAVLYIDNALQYGEDVEVDIPQDEAENDLEDYLQ